MLSDLTNAGKLQDKLKKYLTLLSNYLVLTSDFSDTCKSSGHAFFAAILEDELSALIEECNDYLNQGAELRSVDFDSFQSRSETVIDEIKNLFSVEGLDIQSALRKQTKKEERPSPINNLFPLPIRLKT